MMEKKIRVRVDCELSEFEVKVRMHHGSVLPPFIYVIVTDVATDFAGRSTELLYTDDLVLMS